MILGMQAKVEAKKKMSHLQGWKVVLIIILLVFQGGCSFFQKKQNSEHLPLLSLNSGLLPGLLKQSVTVEGSGQSITFLAISKTSENSFKSVAILPTGQQLYAFEYNGSEVSSSVSEYMNIDAIEILAIQQFALWSDDSLLREYAKVMGWKVNIKPDLRTLYHENIPVLSAVYSMENVVISHHLKGYEMKIKTLEKKIL